MSRMGEGGVFASIPMRIQLSPKRKPMAFQDFGVENVGAIEPGG